MIIKVNVQADSKRIRVDVPQAETLIDTWSTIAHSSQKIAAVGEEAENLKTTHLSELEQYKAHLDINFDFEYPFDTAQFSPEFAVKTLQFYTFKTYLNIRPGALGQLLGLFDRFDYRLNIDGYETLSVKVRQEFEYELLASLSKVRTLLINGQTVKLETAFLREKRKAKRRQAIPKWILHLCLFFLYFIVIGLGCVGIQIVLPSNKPIEYREIPGVASMFFGILVVGYLGMFLIILSYILVMRLFVSRSALRDILQSAKLGLPKFVTSWFIESLLSEVS